MINIKDMLLVGDNLILNSAKTEINVWLQNFLNTNHWAKYDNDKEII